MEGPGFSPSQIRPVLPPLPRRREPFRCGLFVGGMTNTYFTSCEAVNMLNSRLVNLLRIGDTASRQRLTNLTACEFNDRMTSDRKTTLATIAEVVSAFGGTKALADWAGVGESAISNWLARGEIPPGWHYRLHIEAGARGFEIDNRLFDAPRKPRRRDGASHHQNSAANNAA